jgi:hypothetical protein
MYVMNPQAVALEYPDGRYNRGEERPRRRSSASANLPTAAQRFDEAAPVIGAPPLYGPPVSFVVGAWVLLVLLIIPPAAFLITLVLVAAVPAALGVVLVAPPYLLVRHLRARRQARRRELASLERTAPRVPSRPVPAVSAPSGPRGWRPAHAHLVPLATK